MGYGVTMDAAHHVPRPIWLSNSGKEADLLVKVRPEAVNVRNRKDA